MILISFDSSVDQVCVTTQVPSCDCFMKWVPSNGTEFHIGGLFTVSHEYT